MRIYVLEGLRNLPSIDLITLRHGLFQTPIASDILRQVDSLSKCDAALVPHDAYFFNQNKDFVSYLNEISKFKTVVFSDRGDYPKRPKISNSVALRVALEPGERVTGKIIVPYNVESLSFVPLREYRRTPEVSFVGYVPNISIGRVARTLMHSPFHPVKGNGAIARRTVIRQLQHSNLAHSIIPRGSYGAHIHTAIELDSSRSEYIRSIQESDYVLSPRGDANQSARFYEALSAGRIPIVPNTNLTLPVYGTKCATPNLTPYLSTLLFSSPKRLKKIVLSHWATLDSKDSYMQTQISLRKLFTDGLEFNAFFRALFGLSYLDFINRAHLKIYD